MWRGLGRRARGGFQYLPCVWTQILIYDAFGSDGMGGTSVKVLDFRDLTEVLPGGHGSRLRKISEVSRFRDTSLILFDTGRLARLNCVSEINQTDSLH